MTPENLKVNLFVYYYELCMDELKMLKEFGVDNPNTKVASCRRKAIFGFLRNNNLMIDFHLWTKRENKKFCYNLGQGIYSFFDDAEKMRDFFELSEKEFLLSYSYLKRNEYFVTAFEAKVKEVSTYEKYKEMCYGFQNECK